MFKITKSNLASQQKLWRFYKIFESSWVRQEFYKFKKVTKMAKTA